MRCKKSSVTMCLSDSRLFALCTSYRCLGKEAFLCLVSLIVSELNMCVCTMDNTLFCSCLLVTGVSCIGAGFMEEGHLR